MQIFSFIVYISLVRLCDNINANRLGLENDGAAQALEGQPRQAQLRLLNLGDFVNVLEADGADRLVAGLLRAASHALFVLGRRVDAVEQQPRRLRRANVEGERAVGADGDAAGHGGSDDVVGGPGVEFLQERTVSAAEIGSRRRIGRSQRDVVTLQKSIDLTPLLPRAGPTGGLGEAWPAPTMSLTIWSAAAPAPLAFDMVDGGIVLVWDGRL